METMIVILILVLIIARLIWESFLSLINMGEVRRRESDPPESISRVMDEKTYQKSVRYTPARDYVGAEFMVSALSKLNQKNLSNLTPHPLYSGFYYSHPTFFERERALRKIQGAS
jgi:hypothetical protein